MMKTLNYKIILVLMFLGAYALLPAAPAHITTELTREIHETFDVTQGVKLAIHNKHGHLSISTWDKNQVQVDVLIKVKSSNSENAQNFLNDIMIDFDASPSNVQMKTVYPDQNNSWWNDWFGNKNNIDYEVNYTVKAPKNMHSHLINKYGDITQSSIDGNCHVTNKYGNIIFDNVSGNLVVNLGYGKGTFGSSGDTKMQVKYSTIKMMSTKDLECTTKYSEIKINNSDNVVAQTKYDVYRIENLVSLKNNGKYDEFYIQSIDKIGMETKYTHVKIGQLNHTAIFETKYGSIAVNATTSSLDRIEIESKYTHFTFDIEHDFNVKFDGDKANLHISKPYETYYKNKDGSDLEIKAFRGSKEGGVRISADMKYGELNIK